jgi:hypothetical protein
MTSAFLRLSPDERKLYIDEAAARRGLSPVILEKQFGLGEGRLSRGFGDLWVT